MCPFVKPDPKNLHSATRCSSREIILPGSNTTENPSPELSRSFAGNLALFTYQTHAFGYLNLLRISNGNTIVHSSIIKCYISLIRFNSLSATNRLLGEFKDKTGRHSRWQLMKVPPMIVHDALNDLQVSSPRRRRCP